MINRLLRQLKWNPKLYEEGWSVKDQRLRDELINQARIMAWFIPIVMVSYFVLQGVIHLAGERVTDTTPHINRQMMNMDSTQKAEEVQRLIKLGNDSTNFKP